MSKHKIHVNDNVMVLTGKDRGKVGKVKKIYGKKDRVQIEQVNMVKRHTKPDPYSGQSGGIADKESPIHFSNVSLICGSCSKKTRVGYTFTDDGRKLRFCKKCNEMID